ncbi:MAG TPA: hypothetical protein VIH78_18570 [Terriglobales bacterium]|jgi:hypothetical protein
MKLKALLFLSSVLIFAIGTANAGTPVNGSYYMVDFSPSGYCDAFEFLTYGPSNTAAGTFNGTSGIHDLNTFCDLGLEFAWGGLEIPLQKIQPPNDPVAGSNNNDYDVTGTDIEQYYEFGYTWAYTIALDVTAGEPHRPNSWAYYYEDGDGAVYVLLEGPLQIDAYSAVDAAKFKASAKRNGLPLLGAQSNVRESARKLN